MALHENLARRYSIQFLEHNWALAHPPEKFTLGYTSSTNQSRSVRRAKVIYQVVSPSPSLLNPPTLPSSPSPLNHSTLPSPSPLNSPTLPKEIDLSEEEHVENLLMVGESEEGEVELTSNVKTFAGLLQNLLNEAGGDHATSGETLEHGGLNEETLQELLGLLGDEERWYAFQAGQSHAL